MEILCRFGDSGCGIEDVVAMVGFVVSLVTVSAGVAFARSYIQAARYSKPVVESLEGRVKTQGEQIAAQTKIVEQAQTQIASLTELVTGRAAIADLVGEVKHLVIESTTAHREQSVALKSHDERAQRHDQLIVQNLTAIADRIDSDNGRRDRRASDRGRAG